MIRDFSKSNSKQDSGQPAFAATNAGRVLALPALIAVASLLLSAMIIHDHYQHGISAIETIRAENQLKMDATRQEIEDYFSGVHSDLVSLRVNRRMQELDESVRANVREIFDHLSDTKRYSALYVVEREFDGTRPPFICLESNGAIRDRRDSAEQEWTGPEYRTLIDQIHRYELNPALEAQLSSETDSRLVDPDGSPVRGQIYSIPVVASGKLVCAIAVLIPAERISDRLERGNYANMVVLASERGDLVGCVDLPDETRAWFTDRFKTQGAAELFTQSSSPIQVGKWKTLFTPVEFPAEQRWWLAFQYDEAVYVQRTGINDFLAGWGAVAGIVFAGFVLALFAHTSQQRMAERVAHFQQEQRAADMLRSIALGTSGATGEDFYNSLVRHIASAFRVRYVVLGKLTGPELRRIETLSTFSGTDIAPNVDYDLRGTPCENAVDRGFCLYNSGIRGMFPDDAMLTEMDAESYCGTPLVDSAGRPRGILAIIDDKPMTLNESDARSTLAIFAARAVAEIEREEAEGERLASQRRYRRLFESANDAIYLVDPTDGRIMNCNARAAQLDGYTIEELTNMRASELYPPEERHLEPWKRGANSAEGMQGTLTGLHHLRKDGTLAPVEINATMIDIGGENVNLSIVRDVTEREKAEQERNRLLKAIEQTPETIIVTDPKGQIEFVNPAFEQITGYSSAEAMGKNVRFLESGQLDASYMKSLWERLDSGETWSGRFINRRKDGTCYTDEATISPVRDASGVIVNFVSVQHDITEELKLEEQLRQTQKMEAIGQLAGGVAHDFNNLLQAIQGYSEMARDKIPAGNSASVDIQEVLKASERASALVRQLLTFSRQDAVQPRRVNLADRINSVLKLIRRVIGENIELHVVHAPNVSSIYADPNQVDQILMNLCVNARDAMPRGGAIRIWTSNAQVDSEFVSEHPWAKPGNYVTLGVSDTGEGMTPEIVAQIFEPFFTTKEVGQGTGLGLATVYGIVQRHNGFIDVTSEPGKGTEFRIYLPPDESPDECAKEGAEVRVMPRGHETVLIAEDEDSVRDLGCTVLRRAGYTVIEARDGVEAIRLFEEHIAKIDLCILDVMMPKKGGKEVYDRMKSLRREMPVIFCSGYGYSALQNHNSAEDEYVVLLKPYKASDLLGLVREMLESARRANGRNRPQPVGGDLGRDDGRDTSRGSSE
ncbi:MAG: PAS domain S-box protein [Candidatus Hydrogenedentes bacterium]|nr:PAS domain S-box protein [Candidatus Hydrogenedentota bacterium]